MSALEWLTRDQWDSMSDCPFCGAKADEFKISLTVSHNLEGVLTNFMGECSDCAAMGPTATTEHAALNLWNSRAGVQA